MDERPVLRVWYDFLCPFARIAAHWLRRVQAAGGLDHAVAWKSFSLEHVNLEADKDPDAEVWGQPERRRGILPAAAAKWAEAQGPEVFDAVQLALFDANHLHQRKIGRPEVVEEVLREVGLDGATVVKELLADRRWVEAARRDHQEGEELNVFGVPTLLFPGCQPLFLRLLEIVEGERALEVYRRVKDVAHDPLVHELKKPTGLRG